MLMNEKILFGTVEPGHRLFIAGFVAGGCIRHTRLHIEVAHWTRSLL